MPQRVKTIYVLNPEFPSLAWLARLDWGSRELRVEHGPAVEVNPRFFFEGAWAGEFVLGRPDATEVAFGTGCVILEDDVCFVSSLATTDYLYYQAGEDIITVSNSLALLLAEIEDSLDPAFTRYDEINNTILKGVIAYERDIPTLRGRVHRLMHHNLTCSPGQATEAKKPDSPEFFLVSLCA